MDVNGNNDGSVGFWDCKAGTPSKVFPFYDNQEFGYLVVGADAGADAGADSGAGAGAGVFLQTRKAGNLCLTYVDAQSVQVVV